MSKSDACVSEILPTVNGLEKYLDTCVDLASGKGKAEAKRLNLPDVENMGVLVKNLKLETDNYFAKYKLDQQVIVATYLDPR